MKAHEIPPACRPVQCTACGDFLAVPMDATPAEVTQAIRDHTTIAHEIGNPPQIHFNIQLRGAGDPLVEHCPKRNDRRHCGHWLNADARCCACDARPFPEMIWPPRFPPPLTPG